MSTLRQLVTCLSIFYPGIFYNTAAQEPISRWSDGRELQVKDSLKRVQILPPHLQHAQVDGFPRKTNIPAFDDVESKASIDLGSAPSGSIPTTPTLTGDTTQPAWVKQFQSSSVPSRDDPSAITVDSRGNVYVTGRSDSTYTQSDFLTVKYDSSGALLWTVRYDGPGSGYDQAVDIAVDSACNVYVTGWSDGLGTGYDFATIKYDSSGIRQWVARYNGPGSDHDWVTELVLDADGNVYVTGYGWGSDTKDDYATIKYSPDGIEQWVARYDGTPNDYDWATALAVDVDGNVYVTGRSCTVPGYSVDYVTIKYNSSGTEQWARLYNGPGDYNDFANDIAVDADGNVYVTGGSYGLDTKIDYATIKYDTSGTEQWVARFNHTCCGLLSSGDWATALGLDLYGNVYVSGNVGSGGESMYLTIKYDTAGAEQWTAEHRGEWWYRHMVASEVDRAGNVYVTGVSGNAGGNWGREFLTVSYSPSGTLRWSASFRGTGDQDVGATALASDAKGNVYVTGHSGGWTQSDYTTIKYDSSGVQRWVATYDGPGSSWDFPTALVTDSYGNVYVAGHGRSSAPEWEYDFIITKYDATGGEQWVARYGGPGNSYDALHAIATDAQGNVYVAGESGYDYATVKYNSSGSQLWAARYSGPGNSVDVARAIAVDQSGNVYVTGYSGTDFATIKYNSSGVQQWIARYVGEATALVLDEYGNVYVTGNSGDDYLTIKYDPTGVQQWIARYNGPADGRDAPRAIALDVHGNVYVSGNSYRSDTEYDFATVKYSSSGIEQWVASHNGRGHQDGAISLAVDVYSSVYVTGTSYDSVTDEDYVTLKYDAKGNELWAARYNGPANLADYVRALVVDLLGNVYVTGTSWGVGVIPHSVTTIVYDQSGSEVWIARHQGPGSTNLAAALSLDATGNIYVTGASAGPGWVVFSTVRYDKLPTGSVTSLGLPMRDRWNLISVPLRVDNYERAELFPSSTTKAFAYDGVFAEKETLANRAGYWLKFSADQSVGMAGSLIMSDTFDITEGWNLVGSISIPVLTSSIASLPGGIVTSNFFDYHGSYAPSALIIPGSGYWVKAEMNGKLILSSPYETVPASQRIRIIPDEELPPPPPDNKTSNPSAGTPDRLALEQSYPNPFNPSTMIRYQLPDESRVTLKIYNVLGEEVAILADEIQSPGYKSLEWNASAMPSGVYFYRLQAGIFIDVKKMLLTK